MSIDNHVFYACSHFLSVSERKSRINSFSISKDLILASLRARIYFSSPTFSCSLTTLPLAGLPLRLGMIPAMILLCFSRYLLRYFLLALY